MTTLCPQRTRKSRLGQCSRESSLRRSAVFVLLNRFVNINYVRHTEGVKENMAAASIVEMPRTSEERGAIRVTTHPRQILNSWKEIAGYLGMGVRTVQRYEARLGLPVRRPCGKNRSSVIAFADEIDAWIDMCPTREHTDSLIGCDVVLTRLEQALDHARNCAECNARVSSMLLKCC